MATTIPYMGTKRQLTKEVCKVIDEVKPGPILDLFAGMCSVAQAIAPTRAIWTNDFQIFAAQFGAALFKSQSEPLTPNSVLEILSDGFNCNRKKLIQRYNPFTSRSAIIGATARISNIKRFRKDVHSWLDSQTNERTHKQYQNDPRKFPYCLFTITYSETYFSIEQAIEIDSIRYAIDTACFEEKITSDQKRQLLIALGKACLSLSNSPGHFAQYLTPNESSLRRFLRLRQRSIWEQFLSDVECIQVIGTKLWRKENKAFNQDALMLSKHLRKRLVKPSVVYADPPYTDDQFSRYYHVLDTLISYKYPPVSSKGRYPHERPISAFSHKRTVAKSFASLFANVANAGSDLVLSYPSNGLLHTVETSMPALLKGFFQKADVVAQIKHLHSTFGASNGSSKSPVTEIIYWARP